MYRNTHANSDATTPVARISHRSVLKLLRPEELSLWVISKSNGI